MMHGKTLLRTLSGVFLTLLIVTANGCGSKQAAPSAPVAALPPAPKLIANGVTVGEIPVGGLIVALAKAKVIGAARKKLASETFKLRDKASKRIFRYAPDEFGGYFDTTPALTALPDAAPSQNIPLTLKLDARKVKEHVSRIADLLDVPVTEPHLHFISDGGYTVGKGRAGRALDVKRAVSLVCAAPGSMVDLPFALQAPKLTASDLTGLDDTLISFTTTFHPSQSERTTNLTLAARNIDGTAIPPGGVFSYNDSVGPRTHQTGFKDAIIYVDNRMKKDVGGGICQVSSTLYNCVLLANLEVVERHPHSLPVHYVDAGRDATVAWGGDDFKFRNTTSRPIIVRAVVNGGTLTEKLMGDKTAVAHPDAQVAIHVSPRRTYPDGYAVTAYRIVKEGTLVAREPLGTSFYHNPVGGMPH